MSKDIYRTYSIYKITNQLNGLSYVGQTTRPVISRWRGHISGKTTVFDQEITKVGEENFSTETLLKFDSSSHPSGKQLRLRKKLYKNYETESYNVLKTADELRLDFAEIFFIAAFETIKEGYNQHMGGTGTPMNSGRVGYFVRTLKQFEKTFGIPFITQKICQRTFSFWNEWRCGDKPHMGELPARWAPRKWNGRQIGYSFFVADVGLRPDTDERVTLFRRDPSKPHSAENTYWGDVPYSEQAAKTPRKTCEHCGETNLTAPLYAQRHGDNCLENPEYDAKKDVFRKEKAWGSGDSNQSLPKEASAA